MADDYSAIADPVAKVDDYSSIANPVQVAPTSPFDNGTYLSAAQEPSPVRKVLTSLRESLSPVLGDTQNQKLAKGQALEEMRSVSPLLAAQLESEMARQKPIGEALFTPPAWMPQLPAIDSARPNWTPAYPGATVDKEGYSQPVGSAHPTLAGILAGTYNTGAGIVNSLPSPGGALLAMGGGPAKIVGAGLTGTLASQAAENAIPTYETLTDPNASPQQKTEAGLGELVAGLGAAGGALALKGSMRKPAMPEITQPKGPSIVTQMDGDTHGTPAEANVAANEIAMKPIEPVSAPPVEPQAPPNTGDVALEAVNKNIRDNAPISPETPVKAQETPPAATIPAAPLKDMIGYDPALHQEPAPPTVSRYDRANYDAYVEHTKEFNKVVDQLKKDPENVDLNNRFKELFTKNKEIKNLNGGWTPEPPANAPARGLLEGQAFDKAWQDQGGQGGSENQLVFQDGKVYKRNYNAKLGQAMPNYGGDLQAFKDHIDLHNNLFPSAKITLEGFSNTSDGPAPVTSQPEIKGKPASAREIRNYMQERDFVPSGGGKFTNQDTGISISDLTGRNVLKDSNGDLHVIDPQIKRIGAEDPYASIAEPVKPEQATSKSNPPPIEPKPASPEVAKSPQAYYGHSDNLILPKEIADKFKQVQFTEQALPSEIPGVTFTVRKDPSKIWLTATQSSNPQGLTPHAVAYMHVDANGKASFGGSVLGDKKLNSIAMDKLMSELHKITPPEGPPSASTNPTIPQNAIPVQSPTSVSLPSQTEAGQAMGGQIRGGVSEPSAPRQEAQVVQAEVAPPEAKVAAQIKYRNKTIGDIGSALNRTLDSPSVDLVQKRAVRDLIDQVLPGYPDTLKAATKDMPINQLEDIRDRISSIEITGRDVVKERRAIVEQHINDATSVLKAAKSAITEETPKTNQIGVRLNAIDKTAAAIHDSLAAVKNGWSALDQHTANRDTVFNMGDGFAGFRGGLNTIFGGGLDEAYTHEQNLKSDWKEPIQKSIDSGWVKNKLGFGELDKKSIQRVNIYAQNRMDVANPGIPNTHLADSGITPQLIAHINKTITPRELAYYRAVREVLDNKSGPAVREAMHQGFNVEVGQIKDYWPTQVIERKSLLKDALGDRIKGEAGAEASIRDLINDLQQDISGRLSSKANRGQTIEKQSGASGVINLSENLIDRHLNQAAHLVSHAETVSNLAKLARSDWFAEKYGRGMQKYTLNLLDSVARDSDPAGSLRIPVVDALAKNYAVAILALRLFSQLKHVGNLAYALNEVGPTSLARGFIDANVKDGRNFLKIHAPEAFQRSGGETTIKELIAGNKWQRAQAAMFAPERVADRQIAGATTLAAYRNELARKGKSTENYLMQQVDQKAMNAALITARKVVTSSLRKDSPQAISRGALSGGSMTLSRLQWQFQQTALRQIHYAKTELLDEGIKQGEYAHALKAAAAILGALAFETAMVHLSKVSVGTKSKPGDNNSIAQEMAGEEIRKIPFVGNVMTAAKYKGTGFPTVDVTTAGIHSLGNIISGQNDYKGRLSPLQLKQAKLDALTFAGSVAGVPGATTAGQYFKNKH